MIRPRPLWPRLRRRLVTLERTEAPSPHRQLLLTCHGKGGYDDGEYTTFVAWVYSRSRGFGTTKYDFRFDRQWTKTYSGSTDVRIRAIVLGLDDEGSPHVAGTFDVCGPTVDGQPPVPLGI